MSAKTSNLAAAGAIASTDLLMMVDVSDTSMAASGTNKKPTVAELATAITTVGSLVTTSAFDELARDAIGATLVAGSNAVITVNDVANTITIDVQATLESNASEPLSTVAATGSTEAVSNVDSAVIDLTLDANCTLTFTSVSAGVANSFTLILRQDATGSRTVSWPPAVKWSGGVAPTLSTVASRVDVFTFLTVDAGVTWLGFPSGFGMR